MTTDTLGKIIVTGGAGMIGSNLVRRLTQVGWRVSVVDNLWRGRREHLYDDENRPVIDMSRDFIEADLALPGILDPLLHDVDYVFHLADVVSGIDFVFDHKPFVFRQNILINSNVVDSVRKQPKLKGFVYVGTACSFPAEKQMSSDPIPLKEEDQYPASPESAYGWSKLMGEYEATLMHQATGIPLSILVFHNVYGTPCDWSPDRSQVIPALALKAIRFPEEPFVVWGSGEQGRAFLHVDDAVSALEATLRHGWNTGPIQVGPSRCTSIREIAELVVEASGKDILIQYDRTKPEGDRGRCADYSKAENPRVVPPDRLGGRDLESLRVDRTAVQKMLISQDARVAFIHIQRTGGSSISRMLKKSVPGVRAVGSMHDTAAEARGMIDNWDQVFSFAFVRNPWDRLVSWYSLIANSKSYMWRHTLFNKERRVRRHHTRHNPLWRYVLENSTCFLEFLDACTEPVEVRPGCWYSFCRPQIQYICDSDGALIVDFVGRFENLQSDLDAVCSKINVPRFAIGRINCSSHDHYRSYYTDASAALVAERFRGDIDVFGYRF